jgi:hypothetical protein
MQAKRFYDFLKRLDRNRLWLFTMADLRLSFEGDDQTLLRGLERHIADGLVLRMAPGLFANAMPSSQPHYARQSLIPYLRPGELSYESLESRLSGLGIISQVPAMVVIATTGGSGLYETPCGTVEFWHTPVDPVAILPEITWDPQSHCYLASPKQAYDDLVLADRNLHLVDMEELENVIHEYTT